MKAINQLFPPIALDESWEMEVANRIISLADWASEAPLVVEYFRFLRSVWSHCLFVTRYFPSANSGRSLGDKDFPSGQTTALEMMSIAHQIYVLKSYDVAGEMTTVEPMTNLPALAESILAGQIRGRVVIDVRH
jgi:hypothetical protein